MGEQQPQFSHLVGTEDRKLLIRSRDSAMECAVHCVRSPGTRGLHSSTFQLNLSRV